MAVSFDPAKSINMSAPNTDSAEGCITVTNNTPHDLKVKVRVTESLLFVAKPNIALVHAGCVQIIILRYRPPIIDFPVKPKCQIQYIELDNITDSADVFEKNGDKIQQRNFRINFPQSDVPYSGVDKILNST